MILFSNCSYRSWSYLFNCTRSWCKSYWYGTPWKGLGNSEEEKIKPGWCPCGCKGNTGSKLCLLLSLVFANLLTTNLIHCIDHYYTTQVPILSANAAQGRGDRHLSVGISTQPINPSFSVQISENYQSFKKHKEMSPNEAKLTLIQENMEAFYAALHAESSALSPTRISLQTIFSSIDSRIIKLHESYLRIPLPFACRWIKWSILFRIEIFNTTSLQLSRDITSWSWDYINASKKLESTTAKLSKLDIPEDGLKANMDHFSEFASMENELCSQLGILEERKKELEE